MINVAVNGYGVIGKRVADAATAQPDMNVVGVADTATDYRVALAKHHGYELYGSTPAATSEMSSAGLDPAGDLSDLLTRVDVVVDTTPKGIGAANKAVYEAAGIKAVFQGGESHELTGRSFVAQANYSDAVGQQIVWVVSCNTTAIVRVLNVFKTHDLLARARLTLIRRGTDPWESHLGGMINTLLPEPHIPSHQGPDALTVLPGLDLVTIAASGPFNLAHVHFAVIETPTPASRDEIVELPRPTRSSRSPATSADPEEIFGKSHCSRTPSPCRETKCSAPTSFTTSPSSSQKTSMPSEPSPAPSPTHQVHRSHRHHPRRPPTPPIGRSADINREWPKRVMCRRPPPAATVPPH